MANADISFASEKSSPKMGLIKKNIWGSIKGDAIQKAITGARGTPAANRPAINGITPHEQKGESAPKAAAIIIARTGWPEKTVAI